MSDEVLSIHSREELIFGYEASLSDPSAEINPEFHDYALSKVQRLSVADLDKWEAKVTQAKGQKLFRSPASFNIPQVDLVVAHLKSDEIVHALKNMEIVVCPSLLKTRGMDFSDIEPYLIEHEIYEAWLNLTKPILDNSQSESHILALERMYLLADKDGKAERLFGFMARYLYENGRGSPASETEIDLNHAVFNKITKDDNE
jgi:hypothetical protein